MPKVAMHVKDFGQLSSKQGDLHAETEVSAQENRFLQGWVEISGFLATQEENKRQYQADDSL